MRKIRIVRAISEELSIPIDHLLLFLHEEHLEIGNKQVKDYLKGLIVRFKIVRENAKEIV